jgi:predicted RNA-binding Zn-ribbon protein involved in translation (DUF1610 family)
MAAGGLAIVVAVAGTAVLMAADPCLVRCNLLDRFGWLTPLVTASVLGGATFALLGQRRPNGSGSLMAGVHECLACGRELLGEWRMCPYCGEMTDVRRSPHRDSRKTRD